jgi:RNA polymerase sigma-70 factor (ECF subfamily)
MAFVSIEKLRQRRSMSEAKPETASDDDLVERGRAGAADALTELYHRHRARVFGYVLRMTGDRDLADEVLAATFVTLLEHLDRYRPSGRLVGYLLRIARSRLMDEFQARKRLGKPLALKQPHSPVELASSTPLPDEAAASTELAGRVERALADLSEQLREVVVLRLYEGLDYAAIGEIVGAGETTVRSRMRYALEALRRVVQPIPDA